MIADTDSFLPPLPAEIELVPVALLETQHYCRHSEEGVLAAEIHAVQSQLLCCLAKAVVEFALVSVGNW